VTPISRILDVVEAQRGHLFTWVPVMMALGIGTYFGLPVEPDTWVYAACGAGVVALTVLGWRAGSRISPFCAALALVLVGFLLAGYRAHSVAGPVLDFRYYGSVQGRVIAVDRSGSDAPRLTLDRVVLERTSPARTPDRVRVSLHGDQGYIDPVPGLTVIMTAHLSPPSGPTEPGGFDFRRMAWFDRLGAVGYTRTPALALAPAEDGAAGLAIHRLRMAISRAVQAMLPGEAGAFAAAITTGDRSAMGRETLDALRGSNLAHLLAISGLHMGLLAGFVFAALRLGMAAIPFLALTYPIKKFAAVGALAAGVFYYLLSGGIVATERALIMIATMLIALLFDRRAITLRAVAIAAIIVLTFRPETLTEPGFQMSFAATTALVAAFGGLRHVDRGWLPRWSRPAVALLVSSAVAGAATAPIAAAHFNRIADYGLIANLLAVPLMGSVVMPCAVLAALLWPVGLSHWALAIMRPAVDWILGVAHWVAGLDGAITPVIAPMAPVLPIFALGMLWVILWQGRARLAGLAPVAIAFVLWAQTERPTVLISETGGLVGLMTPEGRALSKGRGEGFVALSWLENDGDMAEQIAAFERSGLDGGVFDLAGQKIVHITGRGAAARVDDTCQTASLVITSIDADATGPCTILDERRLRETGSLAIYPEGEALRFVGARSRAYRLWSP